MAEIQIDKEVDEITENQFNPDIKFKINRVRHWFISNIFGRALSYLVGWTGNKAVMIRCTTAGFLKVALGGSAFEANDVFSGTSANAYANLFSGTTLYSRLDIQVATNDITFKRYNTTLSWDDEITMLAGEFYSFDCVTAQLAFKSAVGGAHGVMTIVAWR